MRAIPAADDEGREPADKAEERMMILFHATTEKKARQCRRQGKIGKPVRGFTSLQAAMAWSMKVGRKVIYEVEAADDCCHKLPDHHNRFGEAWWIDGDVTEFRCVFSADSDA